MNMVAAGSWRQVQFRQPLRHLIPHASGVYVLVARGRTPDKLLSNLYNAVYVGQASDLHSRFLGHLRSPSPDVALAQICFESIDFWFVQVEPRDLNGVERCLISCLGPIANRQAGIRARYGDPVPI